MGYPRAVHYAAALALGFLASGTQVRAQHELTTGNDLLRMCESKDEVDSLTCTVWFVGFTAGIDAAEGFARNRTACFPKGSTNQQHEDVTLKYLRENPSMRHFQANALGFLALQRAYPCPQK